jgi:hypothetical protein
MKNILIYTAKNFFRDNLWKIFMKSVKNYIAIRMRANYYLFCFLEENDPNMKVTVCLLLAFLTDIQSWKYTRGHFLPFQLFCFELLQC